MGRALRRLKPLSGQGVNAGAELRPPEKDATNFRLKTLDFLTPGAYGTKIPELIEDTLRFPCHGWKCAHLLGLTFGRDVLPLRMRRRRANDNATAHSFGR